MGCVLVINGGSSSIKFALYNIDKAFSELIRGEIESIGSTHSTFKIKDKNFSQQTSVDVKAAGFNEASDFLIEWFQKQESFASIKVIGHRVVHGMKHTKPEKITSGLLDELKMISSYDPDHLPAEIKLIEAFQKQIPSIPQIACFDTSFHAFMPTVAKLLAIPRRYYDKGIHRYGFHGLSYSYLMEELNKLSDNNASNKKIILAHLGNGASLAALQHGRSIDTSMGFTPTAGIPMSTRTGDLDAGVANYLMQDKKSDAAKFNYMINHESGLLGISETSSNMEELLKSQTTDHRAAEAVELFCYQTKKYVGAYAAALAGLDELVFSGGIGENAPEIRERICEGLQFLGIEIHQKRNAGNEKIISADNSKVMVRVIKTNEELMIARLVCDALNSSQKQ